MSKELPGEWGKRLGPKGIHSYRDLAARVGHGISQGTMHRLVTGKATSADTVNKVADAVFDGDRDLVWRLRGSRRRDYGDWTLPPEASLLTEEQRSAILAVVQAMVPAEQEEVTGNAEHPAAMNQPGSGPGLRAVAAGGSTSEDEIAEAEEAIAKAKADQLEAIDEMKKKRGKE